MEADGTPTPPKVYEDFKPRTEWIPEDDTLVVYVPGFAKHQMRVQLVSTTQPGSTILRITGERRLHHNTWSKFRIEIPPSENSDLYKISAKLEGGMLFIKQPKLNNPAAKPKEESPTPMPTPQKPADESNVSPKTAEEKPTQTSQTNTENKENRKDQDVPEMSVQEKALENYKWAVGVLATKLKTSRNTVDKMVILLIGLMIGIYVSNTIKSFLKV
ncbi:HSP20-like chaperone [Artemisia annua]|uniref:HSP20-like chaperone n=1 Tax=Artemisia annua TaxID=35608 RepID=A0A2U1PV40_ARTAN|nr:HSP20-like chaperone [Artemisia annua]